VRAKVEGAGDTRFGSVAFAPQSIEIASDEGSLAKLQQSTEIASDEREPGTVGTARARRFFLRQTAQDAKLFCASQRAQMCAARSAAEHRDRV
jgi:hypothetical protein